MSTRRATIMLLVPGRNAVSFAAPRSPGISALAALLVPLLVGVGAQRCFESLRNGGTRSAIASLAHVDVRGLSAAAAARGRRAARSLGNPELAPDVIATSRTDARLLTSTVRFATDARRSARAATLASVAPSLVDSAAVVSVKSVIQAFSGRRRGAPTAAELAQVPANGWIHLQALHLAEDVNVRPFDDAFQPVPSAFAQIDHALRCRITGTEVEMDPRLISILVRLNTLYGKPIQVVSGHRQPNTIGTKKTSQHTLGRAADIRIPGVSIEELKRVAIAFGARGVGLYPEKGFVHVDVRQKNRYFWSYTAAGGEQPDMGMARPRATHAEAAETHAGSEDATDTDSDADSESDDASE